MKLSKTSAQAALALAYLAQQEQGQVVQAKQVARHLGIPADSALKILQTLARHTLIHSRLGRTGGYLMTAAAKDVSLLRIVEAIDGPISGQVRVDNAPEWVSGGLDLLQAISQQAANRMREELSRTSVADLVEVGRSEVAGPVGKNF